MGERKSGLRHDEAGRIPVFWPLAVLLLAVLLCLLCYEKAGEFLNWLFGDAMSALLPQQLGCGGNILSRYFRRGRPPGRGT